MKTLFFTIIGSVFLSAAGSSFANRTSDFKIELISYVPLTKELVRDINQSASGDSKIELINYIPLTKKLVREMN